MTVVLVIATGFLLTGSMLFALGMHEDNDDLIAVGGILIVWSMMGFMSGDLA